MENINKSIKNFYNRNKKFLEDNYPGINQLHLEREFKTYLESHSSDSVFNLESPYLPSKQNYILKFYSLLEEGVPLEYISGKAYFYKSEFLVNQNVLIPRPETEILVELAVGQIRKIDRAKIKIADVGVGTGAILFSIMQEIDKEIQGYALDISNEVLQTARKNYFRLRYSISPISTVEFVQADRLQAMNKKDIPIEDLDLIVTNPPYIKKTSDYDKVHRQVKKFEPEQALFLKDEDYEEWFCQFFANIYQALTLRGIFIMECHQDHITHVKKIAEENKFSDLITFKDFNDCDRFLTGHKREQ